MAANVVNVVDVGVLGSLAQTGNLDILFLRDRSVVITQQVFDEITRLPPGGVLRPNQIAIKNWVNANVASGRINRVPINLTLADAHRFDPNMRNLAELPGGQRGDLSIKKNSGSDI